MTRRLQDRLALVATVVTLLSFGIPFLRTFDPLLAASVVGISYIVLLPILFIVGPLISPGPNYLNPAESARDRSYWIALAIMSGLTLILWAFCALTLWLVDWSLTAPSLPLLTGLLGLATFVVVGLFAWYHSSREAHKRCPECVNEVLSAARICQYCGYRWEPPLDSLD